MPNRTLAPLALTFTLLAAPAGAATPPPIAGAQESLLEFVPDGALGAVLLRRNALGPIRGFLDGDPAMRAALTRYLEETVGVDFTRVEGIVIYTTRIDDGEPKVAVFLRLPHPGTLKRPKMGAVGGVDVYDLGSGVRAAVLPQGVVLGDEGEIAVEVAVATKHAAPLGPKSPLAELTRTGGGADLVIALHAPAIPVPRLAEMVRTYGLRTAMMTVEPSGLITATVAGDPTGLKALLEVYRAMAMVAEKTMQGGMEKTVSEGKPTEAIGAIIGYHQVGRLLHEVAPELRGDRLESHYQLPRLEGYGAFAPLVGMLAAIAVPAFERYQLRAKTTEASMNVRVIQTGAMSWFEEHHGREGKRFAFPPSTGWTPEGHCCEGPDDKCAPEPGSWGGRTWPALGFAPPEPTRYQYRFTSSGRGNAAKFVAEARGDLDCDGVYSLYRVEGGVSAEGELQIGELTVTDELE